MKRLIISLIMIGAALGGCGKKGGKNDVSQPGQGGGVTNTSQIVTFAVFGNTGLTTDNGESFIELIKALNKYGVDFSVNVGNSLPEGVPSSGVGPLWDAVDEVIGMVDTPVYPVVGRNDIFDYKSDIAYTEQYGPLWYSFRCRGVLGVVLNTEDETYKIGFGSKPRIGEEQVQWLEKCLKESRDDTYKILFMSRPLWRDSPMLWKESSFRF